MQGWAGVGAAGLRLSAARDSGAERQPALHAPGWVAFALPAAPGEVVLRAPVFRPCDLGPSTDRRELGFAVTGIDIVTAGGRRHFAAGSPSFGRGFHPQDAGGWRWTGAEAVLPAAMFAGLDRPSVLVVRGFGAPGTTIPHSHHGAFLGGDSWPADDYVEAHLRRMLAPFLEGATVGQAEMLPPDHRGHHERNLAARRQRLAAALEGKPGGAVLFGRSSGARVATLHAREAEVAAVVCLGYPFHAPGRVLEPERHAHLATIATPTLIIQGRDDPYGTADDLRDIALSEHVEWHLVDGAHEFLLDAASWQAVGRRVLLFLAQVGQAVGDQAREAARAAAIASATA
jgi:pimeloyl-ACP methyl ester carboxylesterase